MNYEYRSKLVAIRRAPGVDDDVVVKDGNQEDTLSDYLARSGEGARLVSLTMFEGTEVRGAERDALLIWEILRE